MKNHSQELEELVARIQMQLAPESEVLHDVKILGRHSKRKRQIDVLVKHRIGQYEIQIAIECKDVSRPIDVRGVETFHGLLDDVGVQKGVLVCPKGFSRAAKTRAKALQIELYSPVDTDPHKWQTQLTIPAVCDYRSAAMSFGVKTRSPHKFRLNYDFYTSSLTYDSNHAPRKSPLEHAVSRWNEGRYPTEIGEYDNLPIYETLGVLMDNGHGQIVPVDMYVSLLVENDLYFGELPIIQLSGFRDEQEEAIITNAFTLGILTPEEVEQKWLKIAEIEEAPVEPAIKLTGLVSWIL